MIDLHSHILDGLDDGARSLEESLRMCEIGYRDGMRTIVATPHTLNGVYQNNRSTILAKVKELNTALEESRGFGPEARQFAEQLLKHRLLHVIASDAHSTNGRFPVLISAVEAAEMIVGK